MHREQTISWDPPAYLFLFDKQMRKAIPFYRQGSQSWKKKKRVCDLLKVTQASKWQQCETQTSPVTLYASFYCLVYFVKCLEIGGNQIIPLHNYVLLPHCVMMCEPTAQHSAVQTFHSCHGLKQSWGWLWVQVHRSRTQRVLTNGEKRGNLRMKMDDFQLELPYCNSVSYQTKYTAAYLTRNCPYGHDLT